MEGLIAFMAVVMMVVMDGVDMVLELQRLALELYTGVKVQTNVRVMLEE
jgi:hypothetical protein